MKIKDQAYKQMQQIWYDKLKEGGFQDIENNQTGLLKEWDKSFFRHGFNIIQYASTLNYYERAREMLFSYEFKNIYHKRIWTFHCDGLSERKIALKVRKYKKSMVHYIIAHIAKTIKG
jgi:hypothetical protein